MIMKFAVGVYRLWFGSSIETTKFLLAEYKKIADTCEGYNGGSMIS